MVASKANCTWLHRLEAFFIHQNGCTSLKKLRGSIGCFCFSEMFVRFNCNYYMKNRVAPSVECPILCQNGCAILSSLVAQNRVAPSVGRQICANSGQHLGQKIAWLHRSDEDLSEIDGGSSRDRVSKIKFRSPRRPRAE